MVSKWQSFCLGLSTGNYKHAPDAWHTHITKNKPFYLLVMASLLWYTEWPWDLEGTMPEVWFSFLVFLLTCKVRAMGLLLRSENVCKAFNAKWWSRHCKLLLGILSPPNLVYSFSKDAYPPTYFLEEGQNLHFSANSSSHVCSNEVSNSCPWCIGKKFPRNSQAEKLHSSGFSKEE